MLIILLRFLPASYLWSDLIQQRLKITQRMQLMTTWLIADLTSSPHKTFHHLVLLLSSELFKPLLGRSRFRGRCWPAIQLSHRPEPPGHAVHGEVDGLWTLQDNMVDGLFFCATLTGRRGGYTPFVQAGAEKSDPGAEAVKPDPGFSREGHSGWVGAGVRDENAGSCGAVRPLRIRLVIRPLRFT